MPGGPKGGCMPGGPEGGCIEHMPGEPIMPGAGGWKPGPITITNFTNDPWPVAKVNFDSPK